jgi:hypothetical protein
MIETSNSNQEPGDEIVNVKRKVANISDDVFYYMQMPIREGRFFGRFNAMIDDAIKISYLSINGIENRKGEATFSRDKSGIGIDINDLIEQLNDDELFVLYLTTEPAEVNNKFEYEPGELKEYKISVENVKAILIFSYDDDCINIHYLCSNKLYPIRGAGTTILKYFIDMIKKFVISYNLTHKDKNYFLKICLSSIKTAIGFYLKQNFVFSDEDDIEKYNKLIARGNADLASMGWVYMSKTVLDENPKDRGISAALASQSYVSDSDSGEAGGGRKTRNKKRKNKRFKKTNKIQRSNKYKKRKTYKKTKKVKRYHK